MDGDFIENFVPAGAAIERLAREYEREGEYADLFVCRKYAMDTLAARLRDGFLDAWAYRFRVYREDSWEDCIQYPGDLAFDTDLITSGIRKIPRAFWSDFCGAREGLRSFDRISGDFGYSYSYDDFELCEGNAYAVLFDPAGLPPCSVIAEPSPFISQVDSSGPSQPSDRGRKPTHWWPDFAEELAMHCHDEGPPDGKGTEGQTEMMNSIFQKMAKRGLAEPSRTTVQPVINAVLRRMRSAGKS